MRSSALALFQRKDMRIIGKPQCLTELGNLTTLSNRKELCDKNPWVT